MSVVSTHLHDLFSAALDRVAPRAMIEETLSLSGDRLSVAGQGGTIEFDLASFRRIVVCGVGKASRGMAGAVEDLLGDRIAGGVVVTQSPAAAPLRRMRVIEAGHPLPDQRSELAAQALLREADRADAATLFIMVISGGGSALCCAPLRLPNGDAALTLQEKQSVTQMLLASGATIQEINCVRRHLSAVKGGRLAAHIAPATSLNLILSDVVGDRLDTIASGLTAPDSSTYIDALDVVSRYDLELRLPGAATSLLRAGASGKLPETIAAEDPIFERVHNVIVGGNRLAVEAARRRAVALGYRTLALTSQLTGEAREAARFLFAVAAEIAGYDSPVAKPAVVLAGGETTVTLRGAGKGGRNQELALAFLRALRDARLPNVALLSASTDGRDGPTDAAGAFVDANTLAAAITQGLDIDNFLIRNDSWSLFNAINALYRTGPTGTNVCDLQIIIVTDGIQR